jgi:hypothetical protein
MARKQLKAAILARRAVAGEHEGASTARSPGALFCYGAGNDVSGRAQNGVGPFGVRSLNRET